MMDWHQNGVRKWKLGNTLDKFQFWKSSNLIKTNTVTVNQKRFTVFTCLKMEGEYMEEEKREIKETLKIIREN